LQSFVLGRQTLPPSFGDVSLGLLPHAVESSPATTSKLDLRKLVLRIINAHACRQHGELGFAQPLALSPRPLVSFRPLFVWHPLAT
jgi:hypothetical protein